MLCGNNTNVIHKPENKFCTKSCCKTSSSFYNRLGCENNTFSPHVIDVINVGVTPSGMAIYGNTLFIANNNNYQIANQDSVTVVDIFTNLPITTNFSPIF